MSNFVYDVVTLNGNKQDRSQIPAGENPNAWIQSTDWNPVVQSEYDIRGAIINNRFLGLQQLADEPNVPTGGAPDFMWLDNTGKLWAKVNGTSHDLLDSGGGISGLTAGRAPIATSATTIGNAPWSRSYVPGTDGPQEGVHNIDGGSTNGQGAFNIRPSSGFGIFGAGISFDNQDIDSPGGSVLWNLLNFSSATSLQKWFGILQAVTAVMAFSPNRNVFINDFNDLNDAKLVVGGNIKLTSGGKILYTPLTSANWTGPAPVNIEDAIDRIAAWIQTNGGGPLP